MRSLPTRAARSCHGTRPLRRLSLLGLLLLVSGASTFQFIC